MTDDDNNYDNDDYNNFILLQVEVRHIFCISYKNTKKKNCNTENICNTLVIMHITLTPVSITSFNDAMCYL